MLNAINLLQIAKIFINQLLHTIFYELLLLLLFYIDEICMVIKNPKKLCGFQKYIL